MPYVRIADAQKIVAEVSSADGEVAFVVRKHWAQWLKFWIVVPSTILVTAWADVVLLSLGYRFVTTWWFLLVLAGTLLAEWVVAWVWYRFLVFTVVVVTARTVYAQRIQKLTSKTVRRVNTSEIGPAETIAESFLMRGRRTLLITTKGDAPDIRFEHAGGGEAMERGVSHVLSTTTP